MDIGPVSRLLGRPGRAILGSARFPVLLGVAIACVTLAEESALIDCAYVPAVVESGYPERTYFTECAELSAEGVLTIRPEHLVNLTHDEDGLAEFLAGGQPYYVKSSGEAAPVLYSDNGADGFVDGRARTRRDGKIGFIDKELQLVIAPRFDGALPFSEGRALVCVGCRSSRSDEEGRHRLVGGIWGVIDLDGEEVVPITYPCEELGEIGGSARWCRPDEAVEPPTRGSGAPDGSASSNVDEDT